MAIIKNFLRTGALLVLFVLICGAQTANCAQTIKQSGKVKAGAGQTVKTEYFSVVIPRGWIMPNDINNKKDVMNVAFANTKTGIAITINVIKHVVKPDMLAEQTARDMRKGGLKTGKIQKNGALFRLPVSGEVKGVAFFGGNDKFCTATVVLGKIMDNKVVNEFLRALHPVGPGLFPTKM